MRHITVLWLLLTALAMAPIQVVNAVDLNRKMGGMTLPELDAEDMTIAEIFDFMRTESKRLDPAHAGINFFFAGTPAAVTAVKRRKITLNLSRVPMSEALRYICMAAGLHYRVEDVAVIIADRRTPLNKMETRFYRLQPGVIDTPKTRRGRRLSLDDDDDDN